LIELRKLRVGLLTAPVLDSAALLSSCAMLASLLPPVHIPSIVQIAYYLVVPGYALLRLVNHPLDVLDRIALVVAVSLGLVAGFSALFQSFYPNGSVNQSLAIPVVALVASALSLRLSTRRKES